mgnify:CR=1 FL=1
MEYLSIQQSVKHVKKKFNVPDKWKGSHYPNIDNTPQIHKNISSIKKIGVFSVFWDIKRCSEILSNAKKSLCSP